MATTPPLQIATTPQTPPTPLHGAAYERLPSRHSARISQRLASRGSQPIRKLNSTISDQTNSATTPRSSRRAPHNNFPHSPQLTPKHQTSRRVQILSSTSPESNTTAPKHTTSSNAGRKQFLSASTIMSDGMLPTPIKTPKKKTIPKIDATARVLFQEPPLAADDNISSPRRSRKTKRYNGFSLESFAAQDDENGNKIQIFTDSRDRVPQIDTSEINPFVENPDEGGFNGSRRLLRTSKRRKISGEKPRDPQVDEAIKQDDGMVYVFRGKKFYRKFDDAEDEEEEIDATDLGLLEHADDGPTAVKPLKTLTRRSIRPKRLFQTEQQKHTRLMERDEEALTDIEDGGVAIAEPIQTQANDVSQVEDVIDAEMQSGREQRKRSVTSPNINYGNDGNSSVDRPKKASPFDSWPRVKAGTRGGAAAAKGKKRMASEIADHNEYALDGGRPGLSKKTKAQ